MPTTTFDRFYRGVLKGEVPPAVYLHGPEDVLKEEVITAVLEAVLDPSLRDFNLDARSAADLDPEQAETICHTLPMMADRRVVVIRDVDAWHKRARTRSTILAYLHRPATETVLLLIQGAGDPDKELASRCLTVGVDHLPPERVRKWLDREAARLGLTLTEDAAEHLARVAGDGLAVLRTEMAKLAGLAGDEPLGLNRLEGLLGIRHGETQYDWRDLVLSGATKRAITVLPHVLAQSGVSGVSLVMLLGTSLVGLGLARALYDDGQRGSALTQGIKSALFKARPPRLSYGAAAAQWSRLVPAWPQARIDRALRAALRADDRLKSTTVSDDRAILTDLVFDLAPADGRAEA